MRICKDCRGEFPLNKFAARCRKDDGTIVYRWLCSECNNKRKRRDYYSSSRGKLAKERAIHKEMIESKGTRLCKKCNEEKSKSVFLENGNVCHPCLKKKLEMWQKKHATENRFAVALQQSIGSAKRGNYEPCNATKEEVKSAFTGRCFVCGIPEIECTRKLSLDHCHGTGIFRGWLCRNCNSAAGLLRDSPQIARILAEYIERSSVTIHNGTVI